MLGLLPVITMLEPRMQGLLIRGNMVHPSTTKNPYTVPVHLPKEGTFHMVSAT